MRVRAKKSSQPANAARYAKRLIEAFQSLPQTRKKGPKGGRWTVDISFVNQTQMAQLNVKYRNKKGPTDVLSFPAPKPIFQQGYLGELVICPRILRRQADERELTIEMELMILLAHGILHLLGFDHEKSQREAVKMAKIETEALSRVVPKTWVRQSQGRCLEGLIERVSSGSH